MRSTLLSLATVAATGAGLLSAAPAYAEAGESALILTRTGASLSADAPAERRHVVLACDPEPAGSHPDAAGACATLERAGADFTAIPRGQSACTMEYAPVTVTARGYWHGSEVRYSREFSNPCLARRDTAEVFAF
ncbi:SSI family serine proteinase inhibitor [Actinorugispora endophytica]|uniref:Subtilisin inhibitor-like n=1 Tax=Actinorugispora endophytica TaxID=1605990 RepID=A0A4R6UHM7_9ACTN|nr:SSI family serine proteinase inhibitor [Actinorugispora endophytica]TDQ45882.1 subtilisin inhibitor-like [Actinorugispora endophytica]